MNRVYGHITFSILTVLVLFLGLNLTPLFDWDELNFAESAREMVISKNWLYVQMGYEPFWEKPPLFIWLQAIFRSIIGIDSAWVYKLPNVLAAVLTVNFVYYVGDYLGKRMLGAFWALTSIFTLAPFIYWKSGIIDPFFNLFIVLAIFQWYRISQNIIREERPQIFYFLAGLFLGLAVLTKGPVAILIFSLVVVTTVWWRSKWSEIFTSKILLTLLGLLIILSAWLIPLIQSNGIRFITEFINYQIVLFKGQIEWHNQPWFYHIIVLFFLAFPSSILAIPHLTRNPILDRNTDIFNLYMRSMFWIVLIVFSITTTKIVHYSSLCWWSLSYFSAYQLYLIHTKRWHSPKWLIWPMLISGIGLIIILWLIPIVAIMKPLPFNFEVNLDSFTLGLLSHTKHWNWFTLLPATLFTFWFLYWWFLQAIKKQSQTIYLYLISGVTAILISTSLLPAIAETSQGPVSRSIIRKTNEGAFIESWYYKTYAVYFYGKIKPEDFENLNPEFAIHNDAFYPKQEMRRAHAFNNINKGEYYIITKINYTPDDYLLHKFKKEKQLGGYILWKRKPWY